MCQCTPSIRTPFCGKGDCKWPKESELISTTYQPRSKTTFSRRLVKPTDLNPAQTLFGGTMMAWIDEEAAIYAMCKLKSRNVVTAHIGEINFTAPAYSGDVVQFDSEVVKYGKSSITTKMTVTNKLNGEVICDIGKMVFVHVDPTTKKATPHGISK